MNKLSIIIPAYNAHKTINNTLMSICIQKSKYNYDVLIVNDNSSKNYNEFVDKFKKYLNINEITLSKNVGPGIARQIGIDNSLSKYIMFIDADDYLYTPYTISNLINEIETTKSDVIISNFILERDNKIKIEEKNNAFLHGKIYSRDFIKKNDIKFNNSRKNEDNGFNRLIILLGAKINYLNMTTYVYHDNADSITRKNNRNYKFYGLEGLAYNLEWAINIASKKNVNADLLRIHILSFVVASYYYYIELFNKYDVKLILKWYKNIYNMYKKYNYTENEIKNILKINKKILESNELIISYNDYLNLLEEYHD